MKRGALVALFVSLLPLSARAQGPLDASAEAVREAVLGSMRGCEAGALVVRVVTGLPDDAPDASGLVSALVEPTLAGLRGDGRFDPVHLATFGRADENPAAVAHRLGYALMVELRIRVDRGALLIEGGVWTTADDTREGTFSLRRELGAGLRRYLGFPPVLVDEAVRARALLMPGTGYLAVVAHDLDADGHAEVLGFRRDDVHIMRIGRTSRGRERALLVERLPYPDDLGRHPSPRRRILATALRRDHSVVARTSEHQRAIEVRFERGSFQVQAVEGPCADGRYPLVGGCAALVDGRDFFDEVLTRHAAPYERAPAHFYAYAFERFETRAGEPAEYEALVTPQGRLAMRVRWTRSREEGEEPSVQERSVGAVGYGTALAMGDIDVDGAAELLVSHAAPWGAGDQLSLLRAHPRGALRVLWRSDPLGGSVWVASVGDVDRDGLDELIAVEEPAGRGRASLWIVE